MDTIFKKTEELVRNNPADFQKTTQSITKKILKNNHPLKKSEVLKRFRKIWPDSKGKKVIVIGWLLSDSAIGTGAPSVPTALAEILTERISNADNNLNPANLQEWIRGTIFHQEESKQRLEDAVRAYETENPLKDESAGTAVQQTPAERNGGNNALKTKPKLENKSVKEPSKEAVQAYKLYYGSGESQTEVAKIMTRKLKKPISQGQVSKWVNQYIEWAKANNISIPEKPTIINMDSNKLSMGARTDGRGTGDPRHKATVDPDGDAYE